MQKSRTKCSFVKIESYYVSDLGLKKTNNKYWCGKILIPTKILFIWKCILQWTLCKTKSSVYQTFFLTPVIIKCKTINYEKEPWYKLTNLVITNIFYQSLCPSLYQGSTVLNFIYLFFKKWGVGEPGPPQPLPLCRPQVTKNVSTSSKP